MEAGHLPGAYLAPQSDRVREELEAQLMVSVVGDMLPREGGGRVLDMGCGAGLGPLLAEVGMGHYTGVDFRTPGFALPGPHVLHDLREGLGPVGDEPFDVYVAGFGLASHLAPGQLRRLVGEIARHARSGAFVAIEALGVHSLEWPRLWDTVPGAERTLAYALDHDVEVHPWGPDELLGLLEAAGIHPLRAVDRSLQAGPKLGEGRYWPGLPSLRPALIELLEGRAATPPLSAPLPPLPAGRAAAVHQRLAARRRSLTESHAGSPIELAERIWALERGSGGGFGHGLLALGRVT